MSASASLTWDLRSVQRACVETEAPMGGLTTIRTGGQAAALVTVQDIEALVGVLRVLQAHEAPFYCLGAGSDLLVADSGYPGVVIRLGEGFLRIDNMPAEVSTDGAEGEDSPESLLSSCTVTVGGAVLVADLAAQVADAGLTGLEFACGIPGSVGGGVATNAGAYGRAFADVLSEVQLADGQGVRWVPADDLDWEYRHCNLQPRVIVAAAKFRLEYGQREAILKRHGEILEMRRAVQPQGVFTFGSTFKNPSGGAAGRLLEAAGLKGERRGDAEVSKVHANFVVNLGKASTADVLSLMDHMRTKVHETSGVFLEPEVRLLGAEFPWESSAGGTRPVPPADG